MRCSPLWFVVACLGLGCDRGRPPRVHRIHYEMGGLASDGPNVWRIDVDLEQRAIVTSLWTLSAGSGSESRRPLAGADANQLRELAGCARTEPPGPEPQVSDLFVTLVLDGETRREIKHAGPMTAPCAKQLEERLAKLAPWPQ